MITPPNPPLLSRSATGQDVIHLQCALADAGVFDSDIDGYFGRATAQALSDLEAKHGLAPTGTLTTANASLLNWQKQEPVHSRLPAITPDLASRVFSKAARPHVETNLPYVLNALANAGLADRQFIAMALATIRVETALFLPVSELPSPFNTSPSGKVFDLYDTRAGLGNLGAPDGSRFRGRGFVQLTGRANYAELDRTLHLNSALVGNPYLAHEAATTAAILAAFLKARESRIRTALNNNRLAEARRLVNGGANGLADFTAAYQLALQLLPQELRPAA